MQLNQDSASLVHDGACLISSSRPPLAAIGSQLCVPLPHEIAEPANSGLQRNTHPDIPDNSFHILREPVDSALRESFAPITPEPVESDLDGNGDSQRSLNAKLRP